MWASRLVYYTLMALNVRDVKSSATFCLVSSG